MKSKEAAAAAASAAEAEPPPAAATTATTTDKAMTTDTRRRRRRPSLPVVRRRRVVRAAVVAVAGAAVLAAVASLCLPASAEQMVPSLAAGDAVREEPPQACDNDGGNGGNNAHVCSSSGARTSDIQACVPPNERSSISSDGTCGTPAVADTALAPNDAGTDRSGDDGDADADEHELGGNEMKDDDETFLDDEDHDDEDNDDDRDEHNWDADALGPYQNRDIHELEAFRTAIRADRAYLIEHIRTRSQNNPSSSSTNNNKEESAELKCENEDVLCTSWALQGECDANPAYMKLHCPVACRTCPWLNAAERCRPDPDGVDALGPGDLDRRMERIVSDPDLVLRYGVEVISRPARSARDDSTANGDGMWLIVFHSFLSKEEADRLIRLGESTGYAASEVTVGFSNGQAVSSSSHARTSWNTVRNNGWGRPGNRSCSRRFLKSPESLTSALIVRTVVQRQMLSRSGPSDDGVPGLGYSEH
jgi:ShK domain-like